MATFTARLDQACMVNSSLVCIGLDPDPDRMPVDDVFEFNRSLIDATADLVCAYKPNLAFYEALGITGMVSLQRTVEYIRDTAPQIIVIGDAKRGDIGPSAQAYVKAMFQVWDFDAVTLNPWGGEDTMAPFLTDESRGVFIWCRGSNPGAADLQELVISQSGAGIPLYQHLASAALGWSKYANLGLVVGATYPEQLSAVRRSCPNVPLLIPGVGAQGGDLEAAVKGGIDDRGRLAIINSSRGIIYASSSRDFAEAARREAAGLRDNINQILDSMGKGWPSS